MKTLTLIRHAKSSWDDPALDDHERTLNARGEKAAPKVGDYLAHRIASGHVPAPDFLITSTAVRARTTAGIIAEHIGYDADQIELCDEIYLASERALLGVVQQRIPESAEHAIMFGHNPGFEYLATSFLKRDTDREKIPRFPTCATAVLQFPIEHWALAEPGTATLLDFVVPRML